ncbi:uncharacterized [Tachysurus ichikawai]
MNYFKLLADVTFAWKVSHSQRVEERSLPAIRGTKEGNEGVFCLLKSEGWSWMKLRALAVSISDNSPHKDKLLAWVISDLS